MTRRSSRSEQHKASHANRSADVFETDRAKGNMADACDSVGKVQDLERLGTTEIK